MKTPVGKGFNEKETQKGKDWPQIVAIFAASLSMFNSAASFSWLSPATPVLISDEYVDIDLELVSYLSVIPPVFTIIACPLFAQCANKFGTKFSLLSVAGLQLISWILLGASNSIWVLYISRALHGICDAAIFCSLPIYIAEVTTPSVRGSWGNSMAFFIYIGQFAVNVVGYFSHIKTTALIFICVPVLFFITFLLMPESPYFLIKRGKHEDAKDSLKRLRRLQNVDAEYDQLKSDVERQLSESGTYKDIFLINSNRYGLLVAVLVRGIHQLSGITAFAVYTQFIFQEGGQAFDKGLSSIVYTGALAIFNIFGSFFVDKLGRKLSMTVSCFGTGIILLAQGIYFYLKQESIVDMSQISWFPLLSMVLYVITYSIGLGLVPILLLGELFSASVKPKASCVMTVIFMLMVSGTSKLFQFLVAHFGLYVPFGLFAVCTLTNTFLSYYLIPETKGKTLEEIQQILKGNDKK